MSLTELTLVLEREEEAAAYGHDTYDDNYHQSGRYSPTPPPNDPYASQHGFSQPTYYPENTQFPPPPGSVPNQYPPQPDPMPIQPGAAEYPPQAAYPPQAYPPPPPGGPPPAPTNYDAYASGANPYAPRGPENVSAEPAPAFGNPFAPAIPNDQHHLPDGTS